MRCVCSLLTTVLSLAGVLPHAIAAQVEMRSSPQDSVEIVLARYAEAVGGDALAEINTEVRRGILVRGVSGPVPCEILSLRPHKWWWDQTLAWGDQLAYGFDGDIGWVQDSHGVSPMSRRQALDLQLLFDITSPLQMREMYPEMIVVGSEQVGNVEVVVLLASAIDGLTTELAFDRETGLLLRAGEVFLEDYRDIGGVRRPFRVRLGNMLRVQFTEIRHDVDVDETLFTQPTTALFARDPVLYRRHEQVEVSIDALDACVADYRLPSGLIISITREGNHLFFQTPNSILLEIFPTSGRDFFMRFNHLEFHFVSDETGSVTHLTLGADRSRMAERIR